MVGRSSGGFLGSSKWIWHMNERKMVSARIRRWSACEKMRKSDKKKRLRNLRLIRLICRSSRAVGRAIAHKTHLLERATAREVDKEPILALVSLVQIELGFARARTSSIS